MNSSTSFSIRLSTAESSFFFLLFLAFLVFSFCLFGWSFSLMQVGQRHYILDWDTSLVWILAFLWYPGVILTCQSESHNILQNKTNLRAVVNRRHDAYNFRQKWYFAELDFFSILFFPCFTIICRASVSSSLVQILFRERPKLKILILFTAHTEICKLFGELKPILWNNFISLV